MGKGIKYNYILRGLYSLYRDYLSRFIRKGRFASFGEASIIIPPLLCDGTNNIIIGDHVYIGPRACLSATNAKICFKGYSSAGEDLTIHTGNHVREIGKYLTDVTETNKPSGFDKDVVIEENVWIGSRVTILAGVTIKRGATIAAGAVVTKDVPPYSVVGGIPAKVIKYYWDQNMITEHERMLYPENKRMSLEELNHLLTE